jgi:hypothetical protein
MAINNQVSKSSVQFAGPPTSWAAVVKSDSVDLPKGCTELYVGGTGDVNLVGQDDVAVVFSAVPVGTTIRGNIKRVNSTSTTATLMVAKFV